MKSSKVIVFVIFLTTAVLGGVAVFIGWRLRQEDTITPEVTEAGVAPENCSNTSTANPANDQSCSGSGKSCSLKYCPSWGTSSVLKNSVKGNIVVLYLYPKTGPNVTADVTINGQKKALCTNCQKMMFTFDTKQSDLNIKVEYRNVSGIKGAMGWRSPSSGSCGDNGYEKVSTSKLASVEEDYTEISVQCWGDRPIGMDDFDFNDFMFKIAIGNSPDDTTTTSSSTTTTSSTAGATTTTTIQPTTTTTTVISTTTTTLPTTGLFDDANKKLAIGLVILSFGILSFMFLPNTDLELLKAKWKNEKKKTFEKTVLKKLNKKTSK